MNDFQEDPPVEIIRIVDSLQAVGKRFQECIDSVGELLEERENLIKELSFMKEPVYKEIGNLRAELLKLYQTKLKAEIECDNFKEEMTCTKKTLFKITKAQMTCKYELHINKQDLSLTTSQRKTLESRAQTLSDELAVLKHCHQKEINQLIRQLESIKNGRSTLSLMNSHQTNEEFQSLFGEQWQWLEKYYEPKVRNLLNWSKTRAESLKCTLQEIENFKKQLQPLQEQVTKLNTRRQRLEGQVQFIERKWAEDILQYQEQKRELQEKVSLLKTELDVQKQKNNNIKQLKESLSEELFVYKESLTAFGTLTESSNKLD
ncbi:syncoilin-like isoform X2 [Stegostoma tigrinum]|nr:syncoilin-like isoform X2 [Stegostoma tigrinum]XP_048414195.2 syncoilin-like isoform X2 [Stegostoma tigrinum]XP_048414197.2 syncoilin-like isoform X2 [Stegostoma tigrinum]